MAENKEQDNNNNNNNNNDEIEDNPFLPYDHEQEDFQFDGELSDDLPAELLDPSQMSEEAPPTMPGTTNSNPVAAEEPKKKKKKYKSRRWKRIQLPVQCTACRRICNEKLYKRFHGRKIDFYVMDVLPEYEIWYFNNDVDKWSCGKCYELAHCLERMARAAQKLQ